MAEIDLEPLRRLLDVIGGEIEDIAEFIDDFQTIAPDLVTDLQTHAQVENVEGIRIAAHTLKSNARDLGGLALAASCAELETQAKSGTISDAAAQIAQIAKQTADALSALTTLDLTLLTNED